MMGSKFWRGGSDSRSRGSDPGADTARRGLVWFADVSACAGTVGDNRIPTGTVPDVGERGLR